MELRWDEPAHSAVDEIREGREVAISVGETIGGGPWFFGLDRKQIVIVCARLSEDMRNRMWPYTDKRAPDYVRAYTYADVDALIELFGHVRAVNPTAASLSSREKRSRRTGLSNTIGFSNGPIRVNALRESMRCGGACSRRNSA